MLFESACKKKYYFQKGFNAGRHKVRYVKRENVGHTNSAEYHILKCSDTEKDFRKSIYHEFPMQSMAKFNAILA